MEANKDKNGEDMKCPYCQAVVAAHSDANGVATSQGLRGPIPGAYTICTGCGNLSKFDENLTIVKVSSEEFNQLPEEHRREVKRAQASIRPRGIESILGSEIDYLNKPN